MIEHLEHALGSFRRKGMIKRRHQVFDKQTDPVYQSCGKIDTASVKHGLHDEKHQSCNRQASSDSMRDRVGNLFAESVFAHVALLGGNSEAAVALSVVHIGAYH